MIREKARELLPILQAYAEGKTIQLKVGDEWSDLSDPNFVGFDIKLYRVKPSAPFREQVGYRPYKDCDELKEHFKKKYHEAVGSDIYYPSLYELVIWVKNNNDNTKRLITTFGKDFVKIGVKTKPVSLDVLYTDYEYLDGTPCGINLED